MLRYIIILLIAGLTASNYAKEEREMPLEFTAITLVDTVTNPGGGVIAKDEHGIVGVVWPAWQGALPVDYEHLYISKSNDGGKTWQPAREILASDRKIDFVPGNLAMTNGVWMVSVNAIERESPFTRYYGVLVSYDSGETWNTLIDLTAKFPFIEGDKQSFRSVSVGYAGGSSWLFLFTTNNSVRYIASHDNGQSWGDPVSVHRNQNKHDGAFLTSAVGSGPVAITYRNFDLPGDPRRGEPGQRVTIFSHDQGQTFGDAIPSDLADVEDDGANWALARWSSVTSETYPYPYESIFTVQKSSDSAHSFSQISDPPDILETYPNMQSFQLTNMATAPDGGVMIAGISYFPLGTGINLPEPGYFSLTRNNGATWTKWDRLPGDRYPAEGNMISVDGKYMGLMIGPVEGYDKNVLYVRTYDPARATAASDWQLYQ